MIFFLLGLIQADTKISFVYSKLFISLYIHLSVYSSYVTLMYFSTQKMEILLEKTRRVWEEFVKDRKQKNLSYNEMQIHTFEK